MNPLSWAFQGKFSNGGRRDGGQVFLCLFCVLCFCCVLFCVVSVACVLCLCVLLFVVCVFLFYYVLCVFLSDPRPVDLHLRISELFKGRAING